MYTSQKLCLNFRALFANRYAEILFPLLFPALHQVLGRISLQQVHNHFIAALSTIVFAIVAVQK